MVHPLSFEYLSRRNFPISIVLLRTWHLVENINCFLRRAYTFKRPTGQLSHSFQRRVATINPSPRGLKPRHDQVRFSSNFLIRPTGDA